MALTATPFAEENVENDTGDAEEASEDGTGGAEGAAVELFTAAGVAFDDLHVKLGIDTSIWEDNAKIGGGGGVLLLIGGRMASPAARLDGDSGSCFIPHAAPSPTGIPRQQ